MKGIESGKDKVKKICEVLKKETLEPAKKEAAQILEQARMEAERILEEAKLKADQILLEASKTIEKEKNVFQSSLNQACKQTIESLKQEIENKLFSQELSLLLHKPLQDVNVVSDLVTAVVRALEKEGIDADLGVYVSSSVSARSINALLAKQVLEKLKDKGVQIGSMKGGVEVKIGKGNITIDVTEAALKELVSGYIRKDLREVLFGEQG